MSDPLSVTAGVAGVLSFGIQVCNGVTNYYEHWKSYDEDVKTTYEMINQLNGTFSLVSQKVESNLLKRRPATSQILSSIKLCESGILALENRLNKIKAKEPNLATTKHEMAVAELKKQGKRLLYPFKQGTLGKLKDTVGELRDNLTPALAVLSLDVGEEALVEIRAVRAESQAWRTEERTQQILNWLSPLEFHSRQQAILEKRCGETAGWILEDKKFVRWRGSADAKRGFWCQGKMGSGKSVITSIVVDHLQKKLTGGDTAVIYIYCDWQDSEAQSIENLIGCLLKQLVETSPMMPHMIDEAFDKHRKGKTPLTLSESMALLRETCTLFELVYVAIDALDECDFGRGLESSQMVQMEAVLVVLLHHFSCDLWIFITSRFGPGMTAKSLVDELEIQARPMDLKEYVMSSLTQKHITSAWASPELESKVQNDAQLLQQLCEQCIAQSDEMYLLPQLHITHLKRQVNMRQFRQALNALPSNLNASIDSSLKRLQSQPSHLRELGTRVLVWVAYAKRPMTISELQHALAVEIDDEEFFEDGISPEHILTSSCAGLVALDPNTKIVRFINMSIREYISQMNDPLQLDPQLYILRICTRYLRFCECEIPTVYRELFDTTNLTAMQNQKIMETQFKTYPLLGYAAKYWGQYAKEGLEEKALEMIVDLLEDKQRANFLFAALYAASTYSLESCPSRVSGLHLAALFGLPSALTALLSRMEDKEGLDRRQVLDHGDTFGRTPLFLVASRGNTEVIQILLSNGVNVTGRSLLGQWHEASKWWYPTWARDDYSAEALEIAAEEGHRDIVALLLEYGANLGGDAGIYGGALEAAVFKGHEEIVQLLLEAGADIQATVLQSAVYSGNIKIMKYLLISMLEQERHKDKQTGRVGERDNPNRIDPNDQELSPTTRIQLALYAASLAGRIDIGKLLFEYGADVNAETEGFHCTALAAACAHDHDEMIWMFLEEEGADINQILPEQNTEPANGMYVLTGKEHWKLRRGGSESGRHGTALQAAAYAGNANTVELLLLRGADPNAAGGHHGTALQAAAFGGSLEVVEQLLDYGAEVNTSLGIYGNPLQAALLNGNGAIVERLLNAGADVNTEGGRWAYSIIAAAQMGIVSNLGLLLDANADVNVTSAPTGTALYAAITARQVLETTKSPSPPFWRESPTSEFDDFLAFAQRRRAFSRCQSPHVFGRFLTFAAKEIFLDNDSLPQTNPMPDSQGLLDCAKLLLQAKADPNVEGGEHGTAFLGAIACGNLEAVNLFIQAGTDVSFQLVRKEARSEDESESEDESRSWSEYDSGSWSEDESKYRIEVKTESRSTESEYWTEDESVRRSYYLRKQFKPRTPLAMATQDGKLDIMRALIDAGASPNEESYPYGDTLLHHCGSGDAMQLLIEEGANVEKPNCWGLTPLHIAAWKGSPSMVRRILNSGGSATSLTLDKQTPLHLVASASHWGGNENGKYEVIEILLGAGADVDASDRNDNTPLSLTDHEDTRTIIQLLKADSNITLRTKWLNNIISGCESEHLEAIRWLLENGADVNQGSNINLELEPVPQSVAQKIFGDPVSNTSSHVKNLTEINQEFSLILPGRTLVEEDEDDEDGNVATYYNAISPPLYPTYQDTKRLKDCNPLLKLAGNGPEETERLELLIQANIDLSKFGRNALLLAVLNEKMQIARKLLSAGVEITRTDLQAAIYTGPLHSQSPRSEGFDRHSERSRHFKRRRKIWQDLLQMAKA